MRYCPEIAKVRSACWNWYRDDRVGGLGQLKHELAQIVQSENLTAAAISNRALAVDKMRAAQTILAKEVEPHVPASNSPLRRFLHAHADYGVRHFAVMECGWRVMIHGLRYNATKGLAPLAQARAAIADYDAQYAAYTTIRLQPDAPSEMHDYFFAMPSDSDQNPPGMGASVEVIRDLVSSWSDESLV